MTKPFKLSRELLAELGDLAEPLRQLATELATTASDLTDEQEINREIFDGRSERWQESDAALAPDEWISNIEELAGRLEGLADELAAAAAAIDELPAKPEAA